MLLNAIVASILRITLSDLEKIPMRNTAGKRPSLCEKVIELFWSAIMAYRRSSEGVESLSITFLNEAEVKVWSLGAGSWSLYTITIPRGRSNVVICGHTIAQSTPRYGLALVQALDQSY